MWMAGGGVKGGLSYGSTDDYGYEAVEDKVHIHDWHATILHLLGLDHEKLTYRYAGRDFRLTDVQRQRGRRRSSPRLGRRPGSLQSCGTAEAEFCVTSDPQPTAPIQSPFRTPRRFEAGAGVAQSCTLPCRTACSLHRWFAR